MIDREAATLPPPPMAVSPETEMILAKLGQLEQAMTLLTNQALSLTNATHENTREASKAAALATLAGNQVRDVAVRLEQTIEELRVSSEVLGGVKEASGSAIDMANKAIALGEVATKLAHATYDLTKQIARHLQLELVDQADAPSLELLRSLG
jgi:hypothetical protein